MDDHLTLKLFVFQKCVINYLTNFFCEIQGKIMTLFLNSQCSMFKHKDIQTELSFANSIQIENV
jgi:hypothetical protein